MFWRRDSLAAAEAVRMWEAFFAFHICIAELLSELLGCAVVQRAMGPLAVVLLAPGCQSTPDIVQRPEPACVEALVAQPAVEALDVAVLHRAARLDVHQADLPVFGPADHAPRGELRPVVRAHVLGPATLGDQLAPAPASRGHEPRLVSASSARHSRVYASTTLRMRTIRPVARPSTMKSIAHSWFGPVSRGSAAAIAHQTACASCAAPSGALPHTADRPASRSPHGLGGSTAHAAADSRSAASAAPASPALLATPRCGPASAHTGSSTAPRPAACRPCVRSDDTPPERTPHLLLDRQAPAVFSDHALQRLAMQAQLRHQQLQTAVLVLQRLQPLRLAHVHPAELLLPAVERRRADPVLTAQIRRLHPSLALLQDPDDLLFTCTGSSSSLPSSQIIYERTPASIGRDFRGQVTITFGFAPGWYFGEAPPWKFEDHVDFGPDGILARRRSKINANLIP